MKNLITVFFILASLHVYAEPIDISGCWERREYYENDTIAVVYDFKKNGIVEISSIINKSVEAITEHKYSVTGNLLNIYRCKTIDCDDNSKISWFIIREANTEFLKLEATDNKGNSKTGIVFSLKKVSQDKK